MEKSAAEGLSRRRFLSASGHGVLASGIGAVLLPRASAAAPPPSSPFTLPPFHAKTEKQSGGPPAPLPPSQRVGFAVVGLGNLALSEILPALSQCKRARLAALVSGSPDKAAEAARRYGIPAKSVYSYKDYDQLKSNPDVQAVYIVLPNGMHAEYTVRAAQAGKHVLCEKPMANTVAECAQMIDACKQAGRKLMIAYRIQYEPHHRRVRQLVRARPSGPVKLIESVNVQQQGAPDQWRHKRALAGGGALPDIGLYCLNTTRFLLGEEPVEVSAMQYSTPGDPRFKEVEESVLFHMRFPSGALSTSSTSYGVHESRRYRVHAGTAWYAMDPAFSYGGLRLFTSHAEGDSERHEEIVLHEQNQFALEMDHFADCVLHDRTPFTPGEEGLQDQRIMDAIYESARSHRPVTLPPVDRLDAFRGPDLPG